MGRSKRTVKGLDAEFRRIFSEALGSHQCDRSQSTDIGIMKRSSIVEIETQRGVAELGPAQFSVVDQQRTREARLYYEAITGVEIDNHQLCSSPAAKNRRVAQPLRKRPCVYLTQDIRLAHGNLSDFPPTDRAVEVARDRFGFR